jgi:hypothetical protein
MAHRRQTTRPDLLEILLLVGMPVNSVWEVQGHEAKAPLHLWLVP